MGYKVVLECRQTQVGPHNTVGYRSGDQLPVGHPDAGPDWEPVIVEVDDESDPEPVPTPVDRSHSHASRPTETSTSTAGASQAKTGVKTP